MSLDKEIVENEVNKILSRLEENYSVEYNEFVLSKTSTEGMDICISCWIYSPYFNVNFSVGNWTFNKEFIIEATEKSLNSFVKTANNILDRVSIIQQIISIFIMTLSVLGKLENLRSFGVVLKKQDISISYSGSFLDNNFLIRFNVFFLNPDSPVTITSPGLKNYSNYMTLETLLELNTKEKIEAWWKSKGK